MSDGGDGAGGVGGSDGVNAVTAGSLSEAARGMVADSLPDSFQPLANAAISQFASQIPGATVSMPEAVASFASGALTNGKAPSLGDLGAVSRSLSDMQAAAHGFMGAVAEGNFSSAADAAAAIDSHLGTGMAQAAQASQAVTAAIAGGHATYADGGHGAFGNAVEQLAVDAGRVMVNR